MRYLLLISTIIILSCNTAMKCKNICGEGQVEIASASCGEPYCHCRIREEEK